MQTLEKVFSEYPLKHHAYGIQSAEECGEYIVSLFAPHQYEYVFQKQYERMTIDDVRDLKKLQSEKTDGSSIFVLDVSVIGNEAQNALLKIFEEPVPHTFFVLIVPRLESLLATVRSRLETIVSDAPSIKKTTFLFSVTDFYSMSLQERFESIKELTDTKRESTVTKREVFIIITELEKFLVQQGVRSEILEVLYHSKQYLSANAASLKMILENIAMQLELLRNN